VGRHNWKRTCHDIIPGGFPAKYLVVGETFNPPGNWSSVPPHCHEKDNLPVESLQEEVYYFKMSPSQGFGLQRMYTDDRSIDECYAIQDNDTVALPRGYHPIAAAPGYRLYYLWVLAGPKRAMVPRDDPAHAWLKNCEPILDEV
jgi:5-deoxy-glucuronate isomerase